MSSSITSVVAKGSDRPFDPDAAGYMKRLLGELPDDRLGWLAGAVAVEQNRRLLDLIPPRTDRER